MPVSHIGLTVSHLPTACSFFLSALQPLGYRYIGQQGNQIGLGIHDADFFICQETPGVKAGAAHIAFTAPSRTAVRDFYTAALTAGGRPNGSPANRTGDEDHFNAAILDFDGNSIEVVYRNGPDLRDDGTVVEHSRVITWQRSVVEGYRDDRSIVSSRTTQSVSKQALVPTVARALSKAPTVVSEAPSAASKPASIARSATEPAIPQAAKSSDAGDGAAKKIIGTLLGAAAGAAVAYAMVRSEQDSAKKEADFGAFMEAKAQVTKLAQTKDQPKLSMQDPQPIYDAAPKSVVSAHRNIDAESYYSSPQRSTQVQPRAIEAAPESYHTPFFAAAPPTQVSERRAIEYAPAHSVAPSRTQFSTHRSKTSPELLTYEKARSTVSAASKPASVVYSVAPSTLISSFVPDESPRRVSEGSVHSHHSSRSRAKSSHTSASKHGSSRSRAPSPPPASKVGSKVGSKAASIVGSILGRDAKSTASDKDDLIDDFEIDDFNDTDTVAPSDSISNAGSSSRRSHRSHRSKHGSGSTVSKHSSASKHSKSSRHSSHSHHSHSSRKSRREGSDYHDAEERRRPSVISEPSEASTVKPYKPSSRAGRKDSVTQGQYDGMFDESVQYGTGNVASIPIRGITPSMVSSKGGAMNDNNKQRGMITYAMGQKLRPFEE